ncbi:MAG TPA: S24/S26 family peptidase [Herpetosiphonaceae bacterium]
MQTSTSDRYSAVALDLMRRSGQRGAATRLTVTGTSMLPLLRPGDAVWLMPIEPATLRPGDLLLIRQQGVWLTHRLIAVRPPRWQTKGDNNRLADPLVTAAEIEGRIIALERDDRSIDLRRRCWRVTSRLLGQVSRLEQRRQQMIHRESRLAFVAGAFFRLLIRAIVGVAVRF